MISFDNYVIDVLLRDLVGHASIRVARELGPSARIATLMIDSGLKYVSTDLYRKE